MNPLLRMLRAGGVVPVLLSFPPALHAHIGLSPRLTPTPTAFEASASMISRDDRSFLSKAALDARRQIVISQAVMDQLSNPQIKSLAQQVISEATACASDLAALAEQKGVAIPSRDDSQLSEDWSRKAVGADGLYLGEIVAAGEAAVNLFEDASGSHDSDVASLAQKALPSLQRRLAAAQDLQKAID